MFDRYISDAKNEVKYLSGKNKSKKEKRVLPKAGKYEVKDLENLEKKVQTYQGGLK